MSKESILVLAIEVRKLARKLYELNLDRIGEGGVLFMFGTDEENRELAKRIAKQTFEEAVDDI